MEQQAKKMRLFDWVLLLYTALIVLLVIVSAILPKFALFHAAFFGQSILLFVLSIWALLFLIWLIRNAQRMAGVILTRKNKVTLILILAAITLYYAYSLLTRQFIYYWDYALYYRMQLGFAHGFLADGFFSGVKDVIISVWYYSYSLFNNVFLAAPFALTPQTPNWFVAASAATILPLLYWLIAMFIKIVERILQPKHSDLFFTGGMILSAALPLMHRSLLYGQPDLIGLVFVFMIMILTIPYDFSKTDGKRYFMIIVLTMMTCASRRWYLFLLAAYYACYGIHLILHAAHEKRWDILKRAGLFALVSALVLGAVFFPMIPRVVTANYAVGYSAYNIGGFPAELKSQAQFFGIGLLSFLFAAFLYGVINRQSRKLTLFTVIAGFLMIFLFTRIQNMGYHHTLILVPAYLLLMLIGLSGICRLEKKWMLSLSFGVVLGFGVANAAVCGVTSSEKLPALFSNSALIPMQRDDIPQVRAVNLWLTEHCSAPESAYMIPHGYPYNPDVFRSCDLPDWTISDYLYYGSGVLGTHCFPEGLLLSQYVLTCEPFCGLSLAEKFNSAFFCEIPQKHFIEVKQLDMGNGYTFIVYERIVKADQEEIQFYRDCFAEEDQQFPDLFSGVWDEIPKYID